MKEIEFWIKGGGSFVCQVGDNTAQEIHHDYSNGEWEKYSFPDQDGQMLVDFREVAAINVREVKGETKAGFTSSGPLKELMNEVEADMRWRR